MIGLSLSFCVRDIMAGTVNLADVEKIITGTACEDATDWESVLEDYGRTYWKANPARAFQIVAVLLATDRIDQPRLRGLNPPSTFEGIWIKPKSPARATFDALPEAQRDLITLTAVDLAKPVTAIKGLRSLTDLGLGEAKSVIDELRGAR